jgi:predicted ArsR family transcriptional regulator
MLRYLHRCGQPKGASEIAAALSVSIAQVRYHLHALESYETIKEAGAGRGSPLYESAVSENAEILALLESFEPTMKTRIGKLLRKAAAKTRKAAQTLSRLTTTREGRWSSSEPPP